MGERATGGEEAGGSETGGGAVATSFDPTGKSYPRRQKSTQYERLSLYEKGY